MFAGELGQDARTTLLSAAVQAPSMHNTQPWRFDIGAGTVRVYRDLDRWLRADDPQQTALYISLGAAVLNLRIAAAELGLLAHVTLLPDPHDPDYVAKLTLAAGLGVDPELAALFPYLTRRRTSRLPFGNRWIPERVVRDLEHAARADGALLRVVRDPSRVRRLLGLAAEGSANELFELSRLEERARWVGGERSEDGVPASALGPRPIGHAALIRDLAVRQADCERPVAWFERHPTLALLSVRRHDRLGWLKAGEALQRVLLTATRWGLSASFLHQALAGEQGRLAARAPEDGDAHPQMLLRIGYGRTPDATPRRPLEDFAPRREQSTPGTW
jgi:nitroreductase